MNPTYIRSSSWGTYEMCPMKYFFVYELGMKDKQNCKALMGSVMHKNLELLGKAKIAQQNKKRQFKDEEFGTIKLKDITLERLNDMSFDFYEKAYPGLMTRSDKKTCLKWTEAALSQYDGEMDPRNQNLHAVEEFFDVEVPCEWAKYKYRFGDKEISGTLRLKGTVDVIAIENDFVFHVQDYKSGRRYNWAKEKVKTYEDLEDDNQLLLYYYALKLKYPDKKFLVSIYFVNDHIIDKVKVNGGIYTFAFGDDDLKRAEQKIKNIFQKMQTDINPRQISSKCSHFKCQYMCAFSQIIPEISLTEPACVAIKKQIEENGISATMMKYGDLDKLSKYDGGGRLNVDIKD